MKQKLWLKIAAIVILIHLIGHAIGHYMWEQPNDANLVPIIESMKSYKTNFMGAGRTMADYYQGYSLMLIFWYIMSILILWNLSNNTNSNRKLISSLSLIMSFSYFFLSIAEWIYFFPFAAIISFLASACMLVSVIAKK